MDIQGYLCLKPYVKYVDEFVSSKTKDMEKKGRIIKNEVMTVLKLVTSKAGKP